LKDSQSATKTTRHRPSSITKSVATSTDAIKKKPAIPTKDQIIALRGPRHAIRLTSPESTGSQARRRTDLAQKNKNLKEASSELYDIQNSCQIFRDDFNSDKSQKRKNIPSPPHMDSKMTEAFYYNPLRKFPSTSKAIKNNTRNQANYV
jgi:hypothetical protein